jgi:hypothetical protein
MADVPVNGLGWLFGVLAKDLSVAKRFCGANPGGENYGGRTR